MFFTASVSATARAVNVSSSSSSSSSARSRGRRATVVVKSSSSSSNGEKRNLLFSSSALLRSSSSSLRGVKQKRDGCRSSSILRVSAGGGYQMSPEIEATRKPTPPTNPNLPKVLVAGGGIAGLITAARASAKVWKCWSLRK